MRGPWPTLFIRPDSLFIYWLLVNKNTQKHQNRMSFYKRREIRPYSRAGHGKASFRNETTVYKPLTKFYSIFYQLKDLIELVWLLN